MTLNEYQETAGQTALGLARDTCWYPALGLAGETGEVIELVKKFYRDHTVYGDTRARLLAELGDVLWYLQQIASFWNLTLEDIASANLDKLQSRAERGVLQGSGDNR